jgi:hypothetical protein
MVRDEQAGRETLEWSPGPREDDLPKKGRDRVRLRLGSSTHKSNAGHILAFLARANSPGAAGNAAVDGQLVDEGRKMVDRLELHHRRLGAGGSATAASRSLSSATSSTMPLLTTSSVPGRLHNVEVGRSCGGPHVSGCTCIACRKSTCGSVTGARRRWIAPLGGRFGGLIGSLSAASRVATDRAVTKTRSKRCEVVRWRARGDLWHSMRRTLYQFHPLHRPSTSW